MSAPTLSLPGRATLAPLLYALAAVVATGLVAAGTLALGGFDPLLGLGALWRGAFGSLDQFLSITLVRSVPLLFTGLAVALAFRAGVWNIGAEGQLYAGAIAGAWVGLAGEGIPAVVLIPTLIGASALAGAVWAAAPALLRVRLGIGEVITTLLLNFVAIHLAGWAVHGPLQEARGVFPQTDPIVAAARLPTLVPGTRLHLGFLVAIGGALLLWAALRFTAAGFRVRAVGASPAAARVSGRIRVDRTVLWTFLVSGALAGLAGGVEVAGVTYALYENLSPGHGYTAIAVALLARLHPLGVVVAALFFGALEGGAGAMQREAGIPSAWVKGIEAVVILAVLGTEAVARVRRGSSAAARSDDIAQPDADARPHDTADTREPPAGPPSAADLRPPAAPPPADPPESDGG